jgi:HK97 family phage portal protein
MESLIRRSDIKPAIPGTPLFGSLTRSASAITNIKSVPANELLPVGVVGRPVFTNWLTDVAVQFGYKASSWVYACITKKMKAAASVPLRVQQLKGGDRWEYVDAGDLGTLIKQPNPKMSWQDLTERIVAHLELGGNAILTKVRARGKPRELWIVRPDKIKPIPSRTDYVKFYEYNLDGRKKLIDANDIIHFQYVDPANEFWGISPLMAGGKTVDMEVAAVNWNYSSMENRAVPDGMISYKKEMSKKQFIEANTWLDNQLLGSANTRRPFVMGYDADYKRFSLTPAEMDFIESRKLTREEIFGIFGTPPPIMGVYDKATLANIQTARLIFWFDTMIPLLDDLVDIWNFTLTPDFGENFRVVYDTSGVEAIQQFFRDQVKTGVELFKMGVPFNTLNQRLALGFDDIPGGDVGYIPSTMEPAVGGGDIFDDDGIGPVDEPIDDEDEGE